MKYYKFNNAYLQRGRYFDLKYQPVLHVHTKNVHVHSTYEKLDKVMLLFKNFRKVSRAILPFPTMKP